MWIYKHELFHRDHPEDLYMVRRRTCPGLDGRKQRFSTRKISKKTESDDESSVDDNEEETCIRAPPKKRDSGRMSASQDSNKRARRVSTGSFEPAGSDDPASPVVDTSIIRSVVEANNMNLAPDNEDGDEEASLGGKRNEKLEMLEQSMVVSDVAMKLEEYAKRAMKDRGLTAKSRRGGAGVVTPPFGTTYQTNMSASGLITYDDEYDTDMENLRVTDLFGNESPRSIVTENSEEASAEEAEVECKRVPKELLVPPVDMGHARSITECLLLEDVSSAAVAGFCMTTAPNGDSDMSRKIFSLIGSCETLAAEFHQYRSALKPFTCTEENSASVTPFQAVRNSNAQIWQREGSRKDAVRDFKTFSVNCVRKILGKNGLSDGVSDLAEADRYALERTAEVWLKSVGTTEDFMPMVQ